MTTRAPVRALRCLWLGALLAAPVAAQDAPTTLLEALEQGSPIVKLRLRYEDVTDDAAGEKHARAATLRTVLGYRTTRWNGFDLHVEVEDLSAFTGDLYANGGAGSLANGVTDRPVVADPDGTEVQQAYLGWKGARNSALLGRQEITIADHRFVGNVGWRQNQQSYDALRGDWRLAGSWSLTAAWIDRAHRINGATDEMASQLVHASGNLGGAGRLRLYALLLDYDTPARAGLSTASAGAEWSHRKELSTRWAFEWELELAEQRDHGNNPRETDAGYRNLALGFASPGVAVRAGLERLDGGPDGAFSTPLATLHKFNGWADKFTTTPAAGLEDRWLEVSGTWRKAAWTTVWHDFSAAAGRGSYGSELDLQVTRKVAWDVELGLKAALYDADEFAADTDKWWVWAAWSL